MNYLLIAPNFFGFDIEVARQIRTNLNLCTLVCEKPSIRNPVLQMILQKLPITVYNMVFNIYIRSILSANLDVDAILIIRGECWKASHLCLMRKKYPQARFLLYQWDSAENLPNLIEQLSFFDEVFTFDPKDAAKFGVMTKSLFYKQHWRNSALLLNQSAAKYKVAFIGSDYDDRLQVIKKFMTVNRISSNEIYCHLYRSRWSFYYNKYIKRGGNLSSLDFEFQSFPLPERESIEVFLSTQVILDINPENQVGLSARTFESLALNRKLITTNKNICGYDFYNPNNIYVISRNSLHVPHEFFEKRYIEPPMEILKKYSSSEWIKDFLV
jgi:hypothetical protein